MSRLLKIVVVMVLALLAGLVNPSAINDKPHNRHRVVIDSTIASLIDHFDTLPEFPIACSGLTNQGFDCPDNPYWKVVQHGYRALPQLLADLTDPRPCRIAYCREEVSVHSQSPASAHHFSTLLIRNEYDPKDPLRLRLCALPGSVPTGSRGGNSANSTVRTHTLRVGDVCYAAIGAIVNRRLYPVRYEPSGTLVISSPVLSPALARMTRDEWNKCSIEEHMRSLVGDVAFSRRMGSAIECLWRYYPQTARRLTRQLIEAPSFNAAQVWNFITIDLLGRDDSVFWMERYRSFCEQVGPTAREAIYRFLIDMLADPQFCHQFHSINTRMNCLYHDRDPAARPIPVVVSAQDYLTLISSIPDRYLHEVTPFLKPLFTIGAFRINSGRHQQPVFDSFVLACLDRAGEQLAPELVRYCQFRISELLRLPPSGDTEQMRQFWLQQLRRLPLAKAEKEPEQVDKGRKRAGKGPEKSARNRSH